MIYHLVEYLKSIGVDLPGMGLFNYLSFRAMSAAIIALIFSLVAGKRIIRWIQKQQIGEEIDVPGLCASFCAAVSDTLVPRVEQALKETGLKKIAVAGGVAANSRIRSDMCKAMEKLGVKVHMPPLSLCGDNAAMIGAKASYEYQAGNVADMHLNAYATKSLLGETI